MVKSKSVAPNIDHKDMRANKGPASDDGPLTSLGKAIADPIGSGAEKEEPRSDGQTPMAPGP